MYNSVFENHERACRLDTELFAYIFLLPASAILTWVEQLRRVSFHNSSTIRTHTVSACVVDE